MGFHYPFIGAKVVAIDPDKLLAFNIPEVHQKVTAEEAAFYALSIGLGQDPVDEKQLDFVCSDRAGFKVFPSFPLVVAHPGFWLADPNSGVDAKGVLHASQSLQIIAPLPVGQMVVSKSRVSRLADKGDGKAALIDTETRIEDSNGNLLALLERTTYIRNGGGFGGTQPNSAKPAQVPTTNPDQVVSFLTRPEQALIYRQNGDMNPLHSDPSLASASGFKRPILHGLCTAGIVCHALIRSLVNYNAEALSGLSMRFTGYVLPGETICTKVWDNGAFQASVIERDEIVIDNGCATLSSTTSTAADGKSKNDVFSLA